MSTSDSGSSHFVLVHGSSHGAWSWYKIRCLLEGNGHKVTCPDLRGSGVDPTDPNTITTFQEYNQPLDDIFSALPEDENVILVGHSAGGLSVTNAMYKFPKKIKVAVFVGAAMTKNGLKEIADQSSEYKDIYEYEYAMGRDCPPTSAILKKEAQQEILYQNSPIEDCTLAAMLTRPSPIRAFKALTVPEEEEEIDEVDRVYIKTLHDNVYSEELQVSMVKNWPPSDVYEVDSDHFPLFSNPAHLFGLLLKVVAKFGSKY